MIAHLMKVLVKLTHCEELARGFETNDLVCVYAERFHRLGRCNRNGEDEPGGIAAADATQSGSYRRSRGDPIVDEDDGFALQRNFRSTVPISDFAAPDFSELTTDFSTEIVFGNPQSLEEPLVQNDAGMIVVDDCADSQLRLPWCSELTYHHQIEWRSES